MNKRYLFSITTAILVSGNAAFAQMGQSDWQTGGSSTPGAGDSSGLGQSGWQTPSGGNDSSSSNGLGQSGWQTPSANSGGGNSGGSGLGQSGWQQPAQTQQAPVQQQQFQQPVQQSQGIGQSGWQQPDSSGGNQIGQSGWQQPAPQQAQPLQGSATATKTLGDALNAGQTGNSSSSDIDPAAAAMMMSQLNGGANGAGMPGAAANPGAMMGGGMGMADPTAAMAQQLGPALGAMMMMMPNNNNMMGMPSSRPFTGGFAVPRRAGSYSNNNSGGIGSTVNKIVPPSMVQSMMRQMMYQGMSRAMYH